MIISYNYHRAFVLRVQMYDINFDSQSITTQNSEKFSGGIARNHMMMPRIPVKFVVSFHSRRKGEYEHYYAQHAKSSLYGRPCFENHHLYINPADEDY